MSLAQPLQLHLSPLLWREAAAATCRTFSVTCSKTPLLNTGLIYLTSTVKYAQVNKRLTSRYYPSGFNVICYATRLSILVFILDLSGQKSEDEPAAKKARLNKKPETKPPRQESLSSRQGDVSPVSQQQAATAYQHQDPLPSQHPPSYQSNIETTIPEAQPQLAPEDTNMMVPPAQVPVTVAPAVSSVSITRRDPRMARHSSGVTVTYNAPAKPTSNAPELLTTPVTAPVEAAPKAPLPMPPVPLPPVAVPKPLKTR